MGRAVNALTFYPRVRERLKSEKRPFFPARLLALLAWPLASCTCRGVVGVTVAAWPLRDVVFLSSSLRRRRSQNSIM